MGEGLLDQEEREALFWIWEAANAKNMTVPAFLDWLSRWIHANLSQALAILSEEIESHKPSVMDAPLD